MQQVIKNLLMDKEAVIDNLCRVIRLALKTDAKDDRFDRLQARIDTINQKKRSLIELYLNKEISKSDFKQMNEKYDTEIASAEKERGVLRNYQELYQEQNQLLKQTEDFIRRLSCGDIWDDTFYRHILDKIVVCEHNVLDVHLHMLPEKWRYLVSDTAQLRKEWTKMPDAEKVAIKRHFGTSVGTEVPNLRKDTSQPLILADSQRTTDSGYIEVSKWRFSFKGKEDKRSCEVSSIHGDRKTPEQDTETLLVRVLFGLDR